MINGRRCIHQHIILLSFRFKKEDKTFGKRNYKRLASVLGKELGNSYEV
jgi:hypothetical protein